MNGGIGAQVDGGGISIVSDFGSAAESVAEELLDNDVVEPHIPHLLAENAGKEWYHAVD